MSSRFKHPGIQWLIGSGVALGSMLTAYACFGPSTVASNFSSDSAIPVLMSNASGFNRFDLYFWGQDRFGALPFLIARLVHAVTGFNWTPERLAIVQAAAVFSSAFFFSRLLRPRLLWASAACGAVLISGAIFFNIAQPYGWQLPQLLLAWCALRWVRTRERSVAVPVFLATAAVFFASWQSALSAPVLLAIAVAEAASMPRSKWKRALAIVLPVAVGGGLEGALRGVFQLYAKSQFGHSYRTELHLMPAGAVDAFRSLAQNDSGPGALLTAFALTFGGGALAVLLVRWARRDEREVSEHLTVAAALAFGFAVQLILISLGSHFRENAISGRYLALAYWMALMLAAVLVHRLMERGLPERLLEIVPFAMAAVVSCAPLWANRSQPDPQYVEARESARALAARAPGAFLVSGYWESYLLAGFAKSGELLPLTSHDQYARTPFLKEPLKSAEWIWIGTGGLDDCDPIANVRSPVLYEGDALLERRPEPPFEVNGRSFVPYRAATSRVISTSRPRGCPEKVSLELPATFGAELHLAHSPRTKAEFRVRALAADGSEVPVSAFNTVDNLRSYAAAKEQAVTRFEIDVPKISNGCALFEAVIAKPQQSSSSPSAETVSP